jgi:hypothetical protein
LNYLSGGLSPWGFHFTNVLLHSAVCSLLLITISTLLNDKAWWEGCPMMFNAARAALLTSVLFAVHPIHTESVSLQLFKPPEKAVSSFLSSHEWSLIKNTEMFASLFAVSNTNFNGAKMSDLINYPLKGAGWLRKNSKNGYGTHQRKNARVLKDLAHS